jgi:hypothetical protein
VLIFRYDGKIDNIRYTVIMTFDQSRAFPTRDVEP